METCSCKGKMKNCIVITVERIIHQSSLIMSQLN